VRIVPFFSVLLSAGGLSIFSQFIGLARQVLILSSFGLTRELDFFVTLSAMLSITVLSIATILESNFIGLLTEARLRNDTLKLQYVIVDYVCASFIVSIFITVLLYVAYPLLSLPFVAGFDVSEKESMANLALYFVPWGFLVIPFVAIGACLKTDWQYQHVFKAELLVALVSTLAIWMRHNSVGDVALAYSYGYGLGLIFLAWPLRGMRRGRQNAGFPWKAFLSRLGRQFASNQLGTLQTVAERYWLSHLSPGGASAVAIVQQLTTNLSILFGFKDAYLVPLTEKEGSAHKLARLLCGVFLLAMSVAIFVVVSSEQITTVLFQYGKTRSSDTTLLASLLSIGMVAVVSSTVGTPVWRLLQVRAQYQPLVVIYLVGFVSTTVLGFILVDWLQLGAVGIAIMGAGTSLIAGLGSFTHAHAMGMRLKREQVYILARSLLVFVFAGASTYFVIQAIEANALIRLSAGAAVYAVMLAGYAFFFRGQFRTMLFGFGIWSS